jgi:hypothetical protein
LSPLGELRFANVATTEEALAFIERELLQNSGCSAIELLLLASVRLTPDALLWTFDRNLKALAERFDIAFCRS